MNKVRAFQGRRYKRLLARMDANTDKGKWITTENNHKVHLNENGQPDMGNPHVIAAMGGSESSVQVSDLSKRVEGLKKMKKTERQQELASILGDMPVGSQITVKNPGLPDQVITKKDAETFELKTTMFGAPSVHDSSLFALSHGLSNDKSNAYSFEGSGTMQSQAKAESGVNPNAKTPSNVSSSSSSGGGSTVPPDADALAKTKAQKAAEKAKTAAMLKKAQAAVAKKEKISQIDKEIEQLEHEMYKAQHYGNTEIGDWDLSHELEMKIHNLEEQKKKLTGK
ncbi:MAG: hypothetical protein E7576_07810 [Ruminococcaceae bacterium]|nr:hypothetical protein [Oscillospiraceae bacterium]